MGTLTSHQATNWEEGRRLRAWELSQAGWKQQAIADALGVTKGAVSQWLKRARTEGPEALRYRKRPGSQPKLAAEQQARLPALLEQGAEAFGFRGNVWTLPRIPEVIRRDFGVRYHPSQVGRILKRLGWSRQQPIRRARQRNEEAIRQWKEKRWPRLKRGAQRAGKTVIFVDEAGCYLLPALVRTYAPRGQTPVLREQVTRDHLSRSSGITPEGGLFVRMQDRAFRSGDAVRFLRHLVAYVSSRLLVIWDGSPIHRSQEIKRFLASPAGKDVQLEQLPGYAPDLNPDEGVWHLLKGGELKNVACTHLGQLADEVRKALKRIRQKPQLLRACVAQVGLV